MSRKDNTPFMIRIKPESFTKISTGTHIKLGDSNRKVVQILSVKVTPIGQIEVVGRCKPVKGAESD